jgi:alkylated DNA repair dioxygenase AlkB
MRVLVNTSKTINMQTLSERDVIILPEFFDDTTMYERLLQEMKQCGFEESKLWKLWHGDNHLIADDKLGNWKSKCPTFNDVIERLSNFFAMHVEATRFNWYKDNQDWKPYHRDAAAIDERKAKTQNITVAVSFGATRTASFQHMKTKTRIDVPLPNGSVYVFNKQVNIDWMHGIIQEPEVKKEGRISIIMWGRCDQTENP